MAQLVHELWEDVDERGQALPSMVLAGPAGDSPRLFMSPKARLIRTFLADSYFEAMSIYFAINGWEPFNAARPDDFEPYPEEWARIQREALAKRGDC